MKWAKLISNIVKYINSIFILHTCLEQRIKERAIMPAEKCGRQCWRDVPGVFSERLEGAWRGFRRRPILDWVQLLSRSGNLLAHPLVMLSFCGTTNGTKNLLFWIQGLLRNPFCGTNLFVVIIFELSKYILK